MHYSSFVIVYYWSSSCEDLTSTYNLLHCHKCWHQVKQSLLGSDITAKHTWHHKVKKHLSVRIFLLHHLPHQQVTQLCVGSTFQLNATIITKSHNHVSVPIFQLNATTVTKLHNSIWVPTASASNCYGTAYTNNKSTATGTQSLTSMSAGHQAHAMVHHILRRHACKCIMHLSTGGAICISHASIRLGHD